MDEAPVPSHQNNSDWHADLLRLQAQILQNNGSNRGRGEIQRLLLLVQVVLHIQ